MTRWCDNPGHNVNFCLNFMICDIIIQHLKKVCYCNKVWWTQWVWKGKLSCRCIYCNFFICQFPLYYSYQINLGLISTELQLTLLFGHTVFFIWWMCLYSHVLWVCLTWGTYIELQYFDWRTLFMNWCFWLVADVNLTLHSFGFYSYEINKTSSHQYQHICYCDRMSDIQKP
jgi:hypothetical protein